MKKTNVILYSTILFGLALTVLTFAGGKKFTSETPEAQKLETRCGWFFNPTPSNVSLYDRDGEWIIGMQGGYQVKGEWDWPAFAPEQWIKTNGDYGYGCVCMQMKVNHQTHEVSAIISSRAQLLEICRQDRSLKKWKSMFEK
jgi:hypothetical protein